MNNLNLTQMKCVPCEIGGKPLSKGEISNLQSQISSDWQLVDPSDESGKGARLTRTFKFKDFKEAMQFVNQLADLAEAEGHHPDIAISWNKITLTLWTHKIGGLHQNDFVLAAKIEQLNKSS